MKKVHLCIVTDPDVMNRKPTAIQQNGTPLIVGLTGGIAAGKSTVAQIFKALGAEVWNADEAAKTLYRSDAVLRESIIQRWGESVAIRDEHGQSIDVDRSTIAARVFHDQEQLAWLEQQVHPAVATQFDIWLKQRQRINSFNVVIREAAILFESNSHLACDVVVTVEADESVRIARALKRGAQTADGAPTESQIRARIQRQWTREQRIQCADFVVGNGPNDALLPQVLHVFQSLTSKDH